MAESSARCPGPMQATAHEVSAMLGHVTVRLEAMRSTPEMSGRVEGAGGALGPRAAGRWRRGPRDVPAESQETVS